MSLLIFDLDGTLIDSKLDLANSVNATLDHFGLSQLSHERINSYVGNGSPVLMRRALGPEASEAEVQRALAWFLDYYRDHMLDYTRTYPGVLEALESLRENGVQMAVLTNKPVRFSEGILDGLKLSGYFFRVYGGNSFDQKKPHPIGIETLLHESGESHEHAMMVGDSAVDIRTARNAAIRACGVTYGFQPETLQADPPDLLVDDLRQLAERFVNGRG